MQYFGYLRRNPNDAPDGDFSGYNFWLNKLNSFGGNFVDVPLPQPDVIRTRHSSGFDTRQCG